MIRLKNAKDPDEYINKNGVEKFKEAVKNAMPATEFKISLIKKQYDVKMCIRDRTNTLRKHFWICLQSRRKKADLKVLKLRL